MTDITLIVDHARHCAGLFRLGRDIEAALEMVELIDAAMPLVASSATDTQAEWAEVLNAMLQCQERQDWLGVADWLQVEFVQLCNANTVPRQEFEKLPTLSWESINSQGP